MNIDQIAALTCKDCSKQAHCKKPCIFIDRLAGKGKSTREKLPPPEPTNKACIYCESVQGCQGQCDKTDYKERLSTIQQAKRSLLITSIKEVREIQDVNHRAVAAMLYSEISIKDIAWLLDKSERTIRRICGKP